MTYNIYANVYRQESAHGNHPVELVGKLFDTVLEDFRRALNAAGNGDIEARTSCLNHALQVIGELQSVLDHDRGGEVSRRLDGFYDVTRSLIVEANIHGKPQHIQRLFDLYMPVRQAWKEVERQVSAGTLYGAGQTGREDNKVSTAESSAESYSESHQTQWSA